jgi:hypothetical protein
LINDSKQNGILTLTIPHGSNDFPIVQYAGDTILIMKADISEVLHLKSLLTTFTASTGLHVNFHKSSMVSINVPDSTMQSRCFWLSDHVTPQNRNTILECYHTTTSYYRHTHKKTATKR